MVSGRDRWGDYTPSRKHMGKVKTIEVRARGDWNGWAKFLFVQIRVADGINDESKVTQLTRVRTEISQILALYSFYFKTCL